MISNCGKDERSSYSGGQAGDQTGKEYWLISWYNHPWNCILRHPNASVRAKIAEIARAAAQNNNIGYDQGERLTFWNQLTRCGYDPAAITIPCEADCSSSTAAVVKAAGYKLNIDKLKNVPQSLTTYNMRSSLMNAGFDLLTDSKYLTSDAYLLAGDIILNDSSHVAISVSNGAYADTSYGASTVTPTPAAPANPGTSPGGASPTPANTPTLPTTTNVKQGDLVAIQEGASWWSGSTIPDWVKQRKWYVLSINGMRAVLGRDENKQYNIVSPIHAGYLTVAGAKAAETPVTTPTTQTTPAVEQPANTGISGTYTVQRGDTLWGISEKWCGKGWKYTEIQKANGLKSITIYPGQVLTLPEKE